MSIDRKKVTFAEAEGKVRFPDILRWGELDQRVRASLWNSLLPFFTENVRSRPYESSSYYSEPLRTILLGEFINRRHGFGSDFIWHYPTRARCIEDWAGIFKQWEYVELFDFLTFFLRDSSCPNELRLGVQAALDHSWSPYRLLLKPPTIIPAITDEEGKVIKSDLEKVFKSKLSGSKTHMQNALDALNKDDNLSVIRESIHAVESAVRDFTGSKSATLASALKTLGAQDNAHQALFSAFEKLYAYTSDEKGIRHALVFAKNENVGVAEAVFFVSACSAFIAYLARTPSTKPKEKK
jgi:hypothetical protein